MTAYNDLPRSIRDKWNELLPTIDMHPVSPVVPFLFELIGVDMRALRSDRLLQVAALLEAIRETK